MSRSQNNPPIALTDLIDNQTGQVLIEAGKELTTHYYYTSILLDIAHDANRLWMDGQGNVGQRPYIGQE